MKLDPALVTELIARNEARDHLLDFTRYTHLNWIDGEHHKRICDAMEALARRDIRKLMIEAPPRHGKTELSSRRFPAWYLGNHPDQQIIVATYSDELARDNGLDVLNIVRDPTYQHIFPGVELSADAQASGRWRTTDGGIYFATGIGGAVTGRGFDFGSIDDPMKSREEADSPRMREVVWRWYWGTFDTRAMPGAVRLITTTRWREDDLCGRLLELEGKEWTVLELPAIANEGSDNEQALWPDRYSLDYMKTKREDLRRAGRGREWNAQYQQRPTAEEGTYVLRTWFTERWKDPPDPARFYIASDFAVTEPREGADPDSTEHGVFATASDGRLYVMDWWSGQMTAEKWLDALLSLVKRWKPLAWFGEGGVIRRAIEPLMTRICREQQTWVNAQWISPIADKATRGRAFQAWASMGRVVFPQTAWAERVIDQCCDFPGGKHDDAFDVLATMCGVIDNAHPAVQSTIEDPKAKEARLRDKEWQSGSQPKVQSWKMK